MHTHMCACVHMQLLRLTVTLTHMNTLHLSLSLITLINLTYVSYGNTIWHARGKVPCTSIPHALIIIFLRPELPSVLSTIDSLDRSAWLEQLCRSANLPRHEHSRFVGHDFIVGPKSRCVYVCSFFVLWVVASRSRPLHPHLWVCQISPMPFGFRNFPICPYEIRLNALIFWNSIEYPLGFEIFSHAPITSFSLWLLGLFLFLFYFFLFSCFSAASFCFSSIFFLPSFCDIFFLSCAYFFSFFFFFVFFFKVRKIMISSS